jgi:hypothetical protein
MRIVILCLLTMMVLSCSSGEPCVEYVFPRLREDLLSESRESIRRAMFFIAERHGPPVPEGANTLTEWKEARGPFLAWVGAIQATDVQVLDVQYSEFCRLWAPYYFD